MFRHVRFAIRSLSKTPATTAFVILSLALGVGANTAIFSLFDQILMRPLDVPQPGEVVTLISKGAKSGRTAPSVSGGIDTIFSYPMFRDLEQKQTALRGLAGFRMAEANLAYSGGDVAPGSLLLVSGQYFDVTGVKPFMGRVLTPEDDRNRAAFTVVSHRYWQNKLNNDANIVNQKLIINGQPFTIAGVLPRGFEGTTFGVSPEVFVPLSWKAAMTPGWDGTREHADWWLHLIGRLQPGSTMDQTAELLNRLYAPLLTDELKLFSGHMSKTFKEQYPKQRIELEPAGYSSGMVRDFLQTPMRLLLATTILVLLIACANVANLLLTRAARRGPELMVRLAIGAGPAEIFKLVLVESMIFAIAGALLGLLTGAWVLSLFVPQINLGGSQLAGLQASLDSRVLVFTLALSIATGLLFGLAPAWTASRLSIGSALRSASGQVSLAGASKIRKGLVALQVALSLVLLISAAAFTRNLYNIAHIQVGLDLDRVVTFNLSPELNGYSLPRRLALYQHVQDRLLTVPGVAGVSSATIPLLAQNRWGNSIVVEGSREADAHSFFNQVGPGFVTTLGTPLLQGRDFNDRDNSTASKVAIVNETFVEKYCKGRNPIGVRFGAGYGPDVKLELTIVGVMKNTAYGSVKDEPYPMYVIPYSQARSVESMQFFVRMQQEQAASFIPQLRQILREIDPNLPIDPVQPLRTAADNNTSEDRIILTLALGFALLATLLAAIGLYGVMAYSVTSRTREIGLRLALGAETGAIRGLVMREASLLWIVGSIAGLPAAYFALKYAASLLYGVKVSEPLLFVAPVAILALVGWIAAFLPAQRASRVDPLDALRHD